MRKFILLAAACGVLLAGCSTSAPVFPTAHSATKYWDAQISKLSHGVMSRNDGRGCARVGSQRFSCAGYLRNAQDSLSSGQNVIGSVAVHGSKIHVASHHATGHALDEWLHRFRGDPLP